MRNAKLICPMIALGIAAGCSTGRPSGITQGNAKRFLHPGATTQDEVLDVFGPPNITTIRDRNEVWVYDKVSSKQNWGLFGIGGAGGAAGGSSGGGAYLGAGFGSSSRSETTVMLKVYFDERDVVSDYRFHQTKF